MNILFECKIRYEKMMENGSQKKVVEPYIVEAINFGEAESHFIEEMTPFISGEYSVVGIKIENYSELVLTDEDAADKYYKCKLNFITLDEKSGAEKKMPFYHLVQASSVDDAKDKLHANMKGTMADYEVEMIKETKIMDVYPYQQDVTDEQ